MSKRKSGAEYRKERLKKLHEENKLLDQTHKLDSWLKKSKNEGNENCLRENKCIEETDHTVTREAPGLNLNLNETIEIGLGEGDNLRQSTDDNLQKLLEYRPSSASIVTVNAESSTQEPRGDLDIENFRKNLASTSNDDVSNEKFELSDSDHCQETCKSTSANSSVANDPSNPLPTLLLEREIILKNGPYQPRLIEFPRKQIGSHTRNFQSSWYGRFPWLEYSPSKDAAFCFVCRCFPSAHSDSIHVTFTKTGFKNWKNAVCSFVSHQTSAHHIHSNNSHITYKKGNPLESQLNDQNAKALSIREAKRVRNRELMCRLIDITLLLAKSGKPFRGHLESKQSPDRGLFVEIVELLGKYDPLLKSHLQNGPKNSTYTSNRIQNDLISSLHKVMLDNIKESLVGKKVSIMCDETSDCGHHEQMAFVVRYYNNRDNRPVEIFVAMERLLSTNAESIFGVIDELVQKLGIIWENVMSVCFDGASTMAGEISGVQARCKEKNSKIIYVHCYAHCLNLVLVSACISRTENSVLFDFFGTLQMLHNFIESSPLRHGVLEAIRNEMEMKMKSIKSLSTTRWAYRAEAVAVAREQYPAIVKAVEEILSSTKDPETKAKGKGILSQIKSFNFVCCLEVVHPVLQLIVKVSRTLQDPAINIQFAWNEVQNLKLALETMRSEPKGFSDSFKKVSEKCQAHGIEIPEPRKRKVSRRLDDKYKNQYHAQSKEEELRCNLYYPMLDSMVAGITERFDQESCQVINATSALFSLQPTTLDIQYLADYFSISADGLEAENKLLRARLGTEFLKEVGKMGCYTWLDWLRENNLDCIYSEFHKATSLFSVIPVTSCSCERAFSKLTHVKSKLRVTMKQERLNNLMLPYIEQELAVKVDFDKVIDNFKSNVPHARRFEL